MVQYLECEIYLLSDSVLKLGKSKKGGSAQEKWIAKYNNALGWMPKNSDLRIRTVHGQSFKYHWDVEAGATTAKMLDNIKRLIEDKAGVDPSNFKTGSSYSDASTISTIFQMISCQAETLFLEPERPPKTREITSASFASGISYGLAPAPRRSGNTTGALRL